MCVITRVWASLHMCGCILAHVHGPQYLCVGLLNVCAHFKCAVSLSPGGVQAALIPLRHHLKLVVNANQQPMSAGCNQLPMSAGCNQLPMSAGCNQLPMSAGCNQLPRSAGCNQLPRSAGCNQLPRSAGCNQLPRSAGVRMLWWCNVGYHKPSCLGAP
jgi:hypothetical protein